jgi:hypothetical protein
MFNRVKRGGERKGRKSRRASVAVTSWAIPITMLFAVLSSVAGFSAPVNAEAFPDAGFEDGTFTGWDRGSQTGTLGSTITQNGSGVTIFTGPRTFTHGARGAVGDPLSPYYAPAVAAGSWTFSPNNGTNAVLLQPKGEQNFSQATSALGLSGAAVAEIQSTLTSQAQASGYGGGTPTDAAWITREVELTAGTTYTMAWNYVGTDYVPYNDGSITSLVPVSVSGTPVITVNNYVKSYALLGFTNPGTGDYSTNSFGSTGWQTSTYEVSISGTYELGFASFNLDDTGLSPALMVDSEIGSTQQCSQAGSCVTFGGVEPNNETAPTAPPTTVAETTTTTSTTTTTTTAPPAPTSLEVTSLDDTTADGTLRWAITQANANAGGIYDSITFDVNGTITLTSALPQVTQNLTVTGNGRTQTIIDGNNLYRPFNVGSGRSLTISDMTLKQGQATNGGLIFTSSGTIVATNIRFTGMNGGSAVFNNSNGSTATYTNCTFDYLSTGIAGDHGGTPQLAAGVTTWANEPDSVFTNKTYVIDSVFANNTYGINNYRFTKVQNSQFTNNSYGASVTGLNRTQILDSVFTDNSIGIYHNSWIPTTFNMGIDNRLISGNTFTTNGIAIYLDDTYNNGQKNQSWSTVAGNTWDASGVWIRHYQWNGTSNAEGTARPYTTGTVFAQSSNTFPDTIGAPSGLTATDTGTSIILSWSAPTTGGYLPERYAVSWSGSLGGGGIATGNVGDANALNTSIEISYSTIYSFGEPGETFPFYIRSDNDTFSKYSANSNTVSVQVGESTSVTTTTTTTPGSEQTTTTTTAPVVVVPVQPAPGTTSPEEPTPTTQPTLPEETEAEETLPEQPDETEPSEPETETGVNPPDDTTTDESEPDTTVSEPTPDTEVTEEENFISEEEVVAIVEDITTTGITEELVSVLDSGDLSEEQVAEIVTAVIETIIAGEVTEEILSVLESDSLTAEQVSEIVDAILEEEISEEAAVALATSAAVLASIDAEQATEIFATVDAGALTEEAKSDITAAVQDAPTEVKDAFEEEIDIYGDGFDDYVPTGSEIPVGERRSLIAATAAIATAAAGAAAAAATTSSRTSGSPQGGSSGPSAPSAGGSNEAVRREEEEAGGEIAGPEDRDDEELSRNSIYIYNQDNTRRFSIMGFIKKFAKELAGLSFTLAGSVVVYVTLSGTTQRIALVATAVALAVHITNAMLSNDQD